MEWWINYLYWPYLHICCKSCKTRLDVYMLKQLHHPNLSIEGGLSFTLITHLLDRVVSWINRIDQTSWLMWIIGSSASLLFPAVSTTYLVSGYFRIQSHFIHPTQIAFRKQNTFWRPQPEVCFSAWQVGLLPARSWLWPKPFPTRTIFFNLTVGKPIYVLPDTMYYLILTRVRAGGGRWHAGPSYRGASCQAGHGHSYNVLIHSTLKKMKFRRMNACVFQ